MKTVATIEARMTSSRLPGKVLIPVLFSAQSGAKEIVVDGSVLSDSVTLKDQITSAVYQDQQVASTCYRKDVVGYHQECNTQWTQSCQTDYRQVCHTRNSQVCTPNRTCSMVPVQSCRKGPNGIQVCKTQYVQRCRVTQQCHQNPVRVCRQQPYQRCQQVPKQVCNQVADYGDVPYSCTKTETVYVGQQLDYDVTAEVNLNYSMMSSVHSPNEVLDVKLKEDLVSLEVKNDSHHFLMIQTDRDEKVKIPKPKQKKITVNYDLSFYDLESALYPFKRGISDIQMDRYSLDFKIGTITYSELTRFNVSIFKLSGSGWDSVYSGSPDLLAMTKVAVTSDLDQVTVDLSQIKLPFGSNLSLNSGTYLVRVNSDIKKSDIINKDSLKKKSLSTVLEKTVYVP